MKKQFISFLCAAGLALGSSFPSIALEKASALTVENIIHKDNSAVFTVDINTDSLSYDSARLVVASYDSDGNTVNTASETVTAGETQKSIALPYSKDAISYKAMLLDNGNKMKPLTSAPDGKIVFDKLPLSPEVQVQKDFLSSLDILKDDISADQYITKGEFSSALIRAMGVFDEESAYRNMNLFSDVSSSHPYAGYINLAADGGLISPESETSFEPDSHITHTEAVAAAVRALGYDILAKNQGDYPLGYIKIANDYSITRNITPTELLTGENFVKLIKNILEIPLMQPTSFSDTSAQWEIMDGTDSKSYATLLSENDIYTVKGIIEQLIDGEAEFRVLEPSLCGNFRQNRVYTFLPSDSHADKYRYQIVNAYVKKQDRDYIIKSVSPLYQDKTVTINSDDVISFDSSSGTLTYSDSGKEKTLETDIDIYNIEYNLGEFDGYPEDVFMNTDTELVFIENTGDNVYDFIIATKYTYDIIVNVGSDFIDTYANSKIRLDFEDEEITVDLQDHCGNPLDISDFGAGDAVAIVADSTRPAKYRYYIKFVKITDKSFVGTVESLSTEDRVTNITIDGKNYSTTYPLDVETGASYRFFVNMNGKIFMADENTDPIPSYGDGTAEPEPEIAAPVPYPAYSDIVRLLGDLGITEGFTHDDSSREIKRGEFAQVLCKAISADSITDAYNKEQLFEDVPLSHPYSGAINYLVCEGIMTGVSDTLFARDDTITYADSTSAILKALGYTPFIKALGDNSLTHINLVKNCKLNPGTTPEAKLNSGNFVRLIFNMLHTPVMAPYYVSEEETIWGIMNGRGQFDFVSPLTKMDIYIANGWVQSINNVNTEFYVYMDSDDGRFEYDETCILKNNGFNLTDYMYEACAVYARHKTNPEIASVLRSNVGSSFTVMSERIRACIDDYDLIDIEYYKNPLESAETLSLHLDAEGTITLNGATFSGNLEDLLSESDIQLKFIENNGDNVYDALVATSYGHGFIDYADALTGEIALTNGETATVDLQSENTNIIITDKAGNHLTLSDLNEGYFVAYTVDGNKFSNYESFLKLVQMNDNCITDYITEMYTLGLSQYITTLSGATYVDSTFGEISVGETYKMYIGYFGNIIKATPSEEEITPSNPQIPDRSGTVITVPEDSFNSYEAPAVVTKVQSTVNSAGKKVTLIGYVMDETEGEVIFDHASVALNKDLTAADLEVGDVFMFSPDSQKIADWYVIISTVDYDTYGTPAFRLTEDVDSPDETIILLGEDMKLVTGFIENESPQIVSKGETLTVNGDYFLIRDTTNRYTFDDGGRNIEIIASDLIFDYAYVDNWGNNELLMCPVLLVLCNEIVTDAYVSPTMTVVE